MWLTRKRKAEARDELIKILDLTKTLVDRSEESCFDGMSPAEISMDLSIAIDALRAGDSFDSEQLKVHFAPTGILQEVAMMSGWADEYLRISELFDELIAAGA